MTQSELAGAAGTLRDAADADDSGNADRLRDLADQLDTLADRESGPDHGRLARIQSGLDDVQTAASDDVAATIGEARDELRSLRETLDGV